MISGAKFETLLPCQAGLDEKWGSLTTVEPRLRPRDGERRVPSEKGSWSPLPRAAVFLRPRGGHILAQGPRRAHALHTGCAERRGSRPPRLMLVRVEGDDRQLSPHPTPSCSASGRVSKSRVRGGSRKSPDSENGELRGAGTWER